MAAYVPKRLAQAQPTNTAETTLYTVPGGSLTIVKQVLVANTTVASATADVSVVPVAGSAGVANRIVPTVTVPPKGFIVLDLSQVMKAGDFISVKAGTANALTFTISGVETAASELPVTGLEFFKAGVPVSTRPAVNFIEGANVVLTVVDNVGAGGVDITVAVPAAGHTIKDEGTPLTLRAGLNFIGNEVVASDNAGSNSSDVTINHLNTAVHSALQPPQSHSHTSGDLPAPGGAPATTEAIGTAAAAGSASTLSRSDHVHPMAAAAAPAASAVGDTVVTGAATTFAASDHKHAREAFATNAVVLGTAAAAGAATTLMRSDATIAAFDATSPTTQAFGDAAAVGAAAVAARRDHKHAMMANPVSYAAPTIALGTAAAAGAATTLIRSDATIVAFDATAPTTQAFGDAAVVGAAAVAARRDHKHAMPANPVAYATPSIALGTAAAAGASANLIRADSTIAAFDATAPTTQAFSDTAVVGSVAFAARRDHKHAMMTDPVPAHAAAGDPHTGYQLRTEKAAASGYASLDAGTKVPTAQLGGAGADATKYLRGDQTWQVPAGGGSGETDPIVWMGGW